MNTLTSIWAISLAFLLGCGLALRVIPNEVVTEVNHVEVMTLEVPNVIPKSSANRFFYGGTDIIPINGANHWIVSWVDPITGEYQVVYDPENPARAVAISFRAIGQPAEIIWFHPDFDYFQIVPELSEFMPLEELGA